MPAIYDPEEAALLRRAHEYATGQVPYDNEEDLLNQAQSYAQNPRYWNSPGQAPETYDPTQGQQDYPGDVPESEFLLPPDYQPSEPGMEQPQEQDPNYADMAEYGDDYSGGAPVAQPPPAAPSAADMEPPGDYANNEPIGGTGFEVAGNRPGFIYMGSKEGEAPARAAWNANGADVETPDIRGNAYARQAALTYDAIKAQADAQAQIEASYRQAKTPGDIRATDAAAEYQRRMNYRRSIAAGMSPAEALIENWQGRGGNMGSAIKALQPAPTPRVENLPGIGNVVVTGNKVQFAPRTFSTPEGPIEGQPIRDPRTGQLDPNRYGITTRNGTYHIIDNTPGKEPQVIATWQSQGEDVLHPGPTLKGPVPKLQEYGMTNFSKTLPQAAPAAPRQAEGGYKIGITYKGGLKYLGGNPNDPNSWEHASQ